MAVEQVERIARLNPKGVPDRFRQPLERGFDDDQIAERERIADRRCNPTAERRTYCGPLQRAVTLPVDVGKIDALVAGVRARFDRGVIFIRYDPRQVVQLDKLERRAEPGIRKPYRLSGRLPGAVLRSPQAELLEGSLELPSPALASQPGAVRLLELSAVSGAPGLSGLQNVASMPSISSFEGAPPTGLNPHEQSSKAKQAKKNVLTGLKTISRTIILAIHPGRT